MNDWYDINDDQRRFLMQGEDDFGKYWSDREYDLADERRAEEEARYKAQEPYDYDAHNFQSVDKDYRDPHPNESVADLLSLSIWELQFAKPNYYDWFLDTVREA